MIIPTPEFDPLFANDGISFRAKMVQYIEREFAEILGDRRSLLQTETGLETLSRIISSQVQDDIPRNAA